MHFVKAGLSPAEWGRLLFLDITRAFHLDALSAASSSAPSSWTPCTILHRLLFDVTVQKYLTILASCQRGVVFSVPTTHSNNSRKNTSTELTVLLDSEWQPL
jgi:hypothetical protein